MGESERWKLVTEYDLAVYRCGVRAGDRVRLTRELVIKDHLGNPTGEVQTAGEVWRVIPGVVAEPDIIWMRMPCGEEHLWDEATFWEWFERTDDLSDH